MFRKQAILVLVGALALSMMTGCSRNDVTGVDPSDTGNDTPLVDPSNNSNNNGGINNNPGNIFNPGGGQVVTPVQINATITDKKMSGIWIFKKIKTVTVQLQNPSNSNASGKVTITFSKKGQQVETQEQTFSLAGGQTQTIEVTPTKSSDDAVASATSDSAGGTGGFGGNTGFGGSTGGFGGSTGGFGGSTGTTF